jgi:hypothetical protein
MSSDEPLIVSRKIVARLLQPFFDQGHKEVYVALGCGRVYVSPTPSEHCKRCDGCHTNYKMKSVGDLDGIESIDAR